jgi:hypothetical protein
MTLGASLILIIALFLTGLNIYSSFVIAKSILASPLQKTFQIIIVWLIPLSGVLTIFIHKDNKKKTSGRSRFDAEYAADNSHVDYSVLASLHASSGHDSHCSSSDAFSSDSCHHS